MQIHIRTEREKDHQDVFQLVEKAFAQEEYSDHKEQYLVERLRKSDAFIPALSLVAELDKDIIGFILLTKIHIDNGANSFHALALAPVVVHPDFQHKGIGGQLIREAHKKAKELGYQRIVLLGHAEYYPRFGYERTSKYNIRLPFEAPEENCMIIGLNPGAMKGVSGTVVYPSAFYE